MIVDSSALVAIVFDEPLAEACVEQLLASDGGVMSAVNALEAAILVDAEGDPALSREYDRLRRQLGLAIAPVTAAHVDIARQAYRDFGKGSGHRAQLNFGDCFAYALAIEQDDTLLFVGDDFAHTDLVSALQER